MQGLYGQECIFMANDWHTALVPVYLAAKYRWGGGGVRGGEGGLATDTNHTVLCRLQTSNVGWGCGVREKV
jgi:hypothetical protein